MPTAVPTYREWRIACKIGADPKSMYLLQDSITSTRPVSWIGNNLKISFAFLNSDGTSIYDSLSNITSVLVQITKSQKDKTILCSQTISAASLDATTDLTTWTNKTKQHGRASFTYADTAIDINNKGQDDLWLSIAYTTNSVPPELITAVAGPVTFVEDATPGDDVPLVAGNYIPTGATYDSGGSYTLTGLTAGRSYKYQPSTNDTSIINGSETYTTTSNFSCFNGTVYLTGTASQPVTATLRAPVYFDSDEITAIVANYVQKITGNANYRFKDGQFQLWDNGLEKWIPIGFLNGQIVFGDPVD